MTSSNHKSQLKTNIEDVTNLVERRKQHIVKLGTLYEKRIQLGTLTHEDGSLLKLHEICRRIYKDMPTNCIPFGSYKTICRYIPAKYKRPYHFTKIEDDIDGEGNPTGFNAEITTLVNSEKFTLETEKVRLPDSDDLSQDGTPFVTSKAAYDDICEKIAEMEKATKALESLHPSMVSALSLKLKPLQEAVKKYARLYRIKIPGENNIQTTSVSLNMKKPPYRKNMVGDEVALAQKDLAIIKKQCYHMVFTPEEEMHYWESVRKLRLFLRPQVNEKYKRNWTAYCKLLDLLQTKNISGVAKKDSLSEAKVYDPEKGDYVYLKELEDEMMKNPDSLAFKVRMKGITRNHLRNMSDKLTDVFIEMITDIPFMSEFCELFESKLEPLRNAKACMISDGHK
jgi:hypothetical protein